ncbi:S-adenosylmethionine decarboxylase [Sulfurimonas sp. SAG-AH-194-L11]|nr:S-adenosylmethionine decarboxylase [Sulfurimonas sp. SAG-AH-194-L11]MDF1877405.1 S-adenosylmethionine decarboxylase [Sulfurimonas sp. SAG-AH-194-L11]
MQLVGFNNLKKALSFSFYDFVIAPSESEKLSYIEYINTHYNAKRISELLQKIVHIIEAEVLDVSLQDYEPYGASSMILLGDIKGSGVAMHLDKSHITAHTYPDFDSDNGILSFRVDIELSTCGEITPLSSLNAIFDFFDTDIVTIDYNVRGFTRNKQGQHVYMDHSLNSIQEYINADILSSYKTKDLILQNDNIWQLKLLRTDMKTDEYFSPDTTLSESDKTTYIKELNAEMLSIFNGWRTT